MWLLLLYYIPEIGSDPWKSPFQQVILKHLRYWKSYYFSMVSFLYLFSTFFSIFSWKKIIYYYYYFLFLYYLPVVEHFLLPQFLPILEFLPPNLLFNFVPLITFFTFFIYLFAGFLLSRALRNFSFEIKLKNNLEELYRMSLPYEKYERKLYGKIYLIDPYYDIFEYSIKHIV